MRLGHLAGRRRRGLSVVLARLLVVRFRQPDLRGRRLGRSHLALAPRALDELADLLVLGVDLHRRLRRREPGTRRGLLPGRGRERGQRPALRVGGFGPERARVEQPARLGDRGLRAGEAHDGLGRERAQGATDVGRGRQVAEDGPDRVGVAARPVQVVLRHPERLGPLARAQQRHDAREQPPPVVIRRELGPRGLLGLRVAQADRAQTARREEHARGFGPPGRAREQHPRRARAVDRFEQPPLGVVEHVQQASEARPAGNHVAVEHRLDERADAGGRDTLADAAVDHLRQPHLEHHALVRVLGGLAEREGAGRPREHVEELLALLPFERGAELLRTERAHRDEDPALAAVAVAHAGQ